MLIGRLENAGPTRLPDLLAYRLTDAERRFVSAPAPTGR